MEIHFSEPANLVTNIDGGLGCWTGNAPSYYKIEIIENKTYTNPYPLDSLSIFRYVVEAEKIKLIMSSG